MRRTLSGRLSGVSVATSQIEGIKGEDRVSVQMNHAEEGVPNLASFSVFDGHNGFAAADFCSMHFNRRVAYRFADMSATASLLRKSDDETIIHLSEQTQIDAMMCESIRLTCIEADANLTSRCEAGTTLCSVFILQDSRSKQVTVYCANVGDSRCVLYTADPKPAPNYNSSMSSHLLSTSSSKLVTADAAAVTSRSLYDDSDLRLNQLVPESVYALSEDHNMANKKELKRLSSVDKTTTHWLPVPRKVTTPDLYPPPDSEAGKAFILRLHALVGCIASDTLDYEHFPEHGDEDRYREVHANSFVGRRSSPGPGVPGAEAVFSRYRFSINMTRSLGDRYGPRCCIPEPEVVSALVSPDLPVRLLLATDGVWDVLEPWEVRRAVFDSADLHAVARNIAHFAAEKRLRMGLRADDISVIVVDVDLSTGQYLPVRCSCSLS